MRHTGLTECFGNFIGSSSKFFLFPKRLKFRFGLLGVVLWGSRFSGLIAIFYVFRISLILSTFSVFVTSFMFTELSAFELRRPRQFLTKK